MDSLAHGWHGRRGRAPHPPAVCAACRHRRGLRCTRPGASPRKCRDRDRLDIIGPCRWCAEVPGRCAWTPRECAAEAALQAAEMRRDDQ
jgi:hypothetical protein